MHATGSGAVNESGSSAGGQVTSDSVATCETADTSHAPHSDTTPGAFRASWASVAGAWVILATRAGW